jgi:8-oxo-dGTP diphosphatase
MKQVRQMTAASLAALPRKRMAAGVLLTDVQDRSLLVEPTYKDYWDIPGGIVEADESPYVAAKREVNEELGLVVEPGRLLAVDWVPPKLARTEGVIFVYDGGQLSNSEAELISLPLDELRSWAWCTERESQNRLSELLARRLVGARLARARGVTLYLEDGHPR